MIGHVADRRKQSGGVGIVVLVVIVVVVAIAAVMSLRKGGETCTEPTCCPAGKGPACSAPVAPSALSQRSSVPIEEMTFQKLTREARLIEREIAEARSAAIAGKPEIARLHADVQNAQLASVRYLNALPEVNAVARQREAARVELAHLVEQQSTIADELAASPGNASLSAKKDAIDAAVDAATEKAEVLNRKASAAKQSAIESDPRAKASVAAVAQASTAMRSAIDADPEVADALARKSAINALRREMAEAADAPPTAGGRSD